MSDSSRKTPFYLTTTLPYVNAPLHLGHALEFVRADIIARYKKLTGFEVFFNTGTDEHGLKIYKKALEENKNQQDYVDEYALKFKNFAKKLGMTEDLNFIRTTDPHHVKAVEEFWRICFRNGDIYKKNYKIKYCVGCELEKTDSELVDGKCPEHPNLEIEIIEEENYFFRFSKFQKRLLDFYEEKSDFVIPDFRFNEIKRFVERGLADFSISRLKSKMPWGVEVPGDSEQVMYVWFDALVNYISAIGWPLDLEKFNKWWPVTQYCGKDNIRQQSAMWQAMLMSAGISQSKQVIINGFILGEGGVKMSKSLGNVVDPLKIIEEYGTDVLRFYLARHVHPFEDSEFTMEKFKTAYNADLANGLGNLVSRVMKLSETYQVETIHFEYKTEPHVKKAFDDFNIKDVMDFIWQKIQYSDRKINEEKPFSVIKTDVVMGKATIQNLVQKLREIAIMLQPIMPETSEKIITAIKENKTPEKPLFPRKD